MTRAAAAERVLKLRALADPERGGTGAERQVAAEKAARLIERYGLGPADLRASKPPLKRTWTAPASGGAWYFFDSSTGASAGAVKVHSYTDRNNWKIEIDVDPNARARAVQAELDRRQERLKKGGE